MNAILPTFQTVDEFLLWCQQQDGGRYELEAGRIVTLQAENFGHVRTKQRVVDALQAAIERSGLPFYAIPDGPAVPIAENRSYEPDALIAPLPYPPDDVLRIDNPVIVVEVLSPTTTSQRRDLTTKVEGYGRVASIEHYIIVDPVERQVLHYRRHGDVLAPPSAPSEGVLRLDPPGIEVAVEALLAPPRTDA